MKQFDVLKARLKRAIEDSDDVAIVDIAGEVRKLKADVAREEAIRLEAEAKLLDGKREGYAKTLKAQVSQLKGLHDALKKLKATGFSYTMSRMEQDEVGRDMAVTGGCVLIVPTIVKRRRARTPASTANTEPDNGGQAQKPELVEARHG